MKNMKGRSTGCALWLLAFASHVCATTTWYVALDGTGNGIGGWHSATNSLQGAIDASTAGDTVLVSNGVYDAGGVTNYPVGSILTNRIAIHRAITVRSANNDPAQTVIQGVWSSSGRCGTGAVRCAYMTHGAALIGFTLTNGATLTSAESANGADWQGGGIWCESGTPRPAISNCVIAGNAAWSVGGGALYGNYFDCVFDNNIAAQTGATSYGGAIYAGLHSDLHRCVLSNNKAGEAETYGVGGATYYGKLYHCIISNNWSGAEGGGATYADLYNCLIVANSARRGGGITSLAGKYIVNCTVAGNHARQTARGGGFEGGGLIYNSILYGNTVQGANKSSANWLPHATVQAFTNSCTTPAQAGWAHGNITLDPDFLDAASRNYRLKPGSPCIDAGDNALVVGDTDRDGMARIFGKAVDMGCYEDDTPRGTLIFIQ